MVNLTNFPLVRGRSIVQSYSAAPFAPNKYGAFSHLAVDLIRQDRAERSENLHTNPGSIWTGRSRAVPAPSSVSCVGVAI